MAQANQAHKQRLTQAGCPDNVADQLVSRGCDADHCERFAQLGPINWQALLALVQQYGPAILSAIIAVFGGANPTPGQAPQSPQARP